MDQPQDRFKKIVEYTLPWLVLAILLVYTYARFFQHPHGLSWYDTNGVIYDIYVKQASPSLEVGDQLVKVGQLTFDTVRSDLRRGFFEGISPGSVVPVIVDRGGQPLTLLWKLPGVNQGEVLDELTSQWFLAYIFWLAGTISLLSLRPRDSRWFLLSAFNFLTAVWLNAGGGVSNYHIWYSAIILRMTIWLSVPIYLHLHWVFPRPLGKLPGVVIGFGYFAAILLMIAQLFQLLPSNLYLLGFLVAILGSLVLLVVHAFRQPETRLDLRFLVVAVLLALVPSIAFVSINLFAGPSRADALALLSFPLLPVAYLYSAYRNQLGGLELRVNRLISIYIFLNLVCSIGIPLLVWMDQLIPSPNATVLVGAAAIVLTALASIWVFPLFQNFVERRWLGISYPAKNLLEIYSARLSTSSTFSELERLLTDEILSSLLIKQFVFLHMSKTPKPIFTMGVEQKNIPDDQSLKELISRIGSDNYYASADFLDQYSWIRLALPLKVNDELIGLWLLGRRDPDDFYSRSELPLFISLANQTAIALNNILQSERLRSVYQADINRHEKERLVLARDLHDSILNRLAALMMNLDKASLSPEFQTAYDSLTASLRETVSSLRPPLLDYGLKAALNELADNLMELSQDEINILVELGREDSRYDPLIELYVFRIVQEACGNAIRHGEAKKILISGSLDPGQIELCVQDDGTGFNVSQGLALNDLIANEHFGLAGMVERAELIGANLRFTSEPRSGTKVYLSLTLSGTVLR